MSFDGTVVKSLINEFNDKIINGKISKIYQPEKDEIVIKIRNHGYNFTLLLSASSNNPRIHLISKYTKNNPKIPPMFCMLLRKHLQGGIITDITQPSFERIIKINIKSTDDLGLMTHKELIIEIMGRHSNIILIEKQTQNILDAIKRVPKQISSVRQIIPNIEYKSPPSQNKLNPLNIKRLTFIKKINSINEGTPVYKFIYKTYMGISPLIAREICTLANIDHNERVGSLLNHKIEELFKCFSSIINKIIQSNYKPTIVFDNTNNKFLAFSAVNITQYGNNCSKKYFDTISEVIEYYYTTRDKLDRINQKSNNLKKTISLKLKRTYKKMHKQKKELSNAKNKDKYKLQGDLITANIYKIKKGQSELKCKNLYSENGELITIRLDPKLTPAENAQKKYKRYNKLKNALIYLSKQINQSKDEIDYLENILLNIDNCTEINEFEEIKEELISEGYIKKKRKKKKKKSRSKPHHYLSSNGCDIFVGKNNKQNDYLTLKFANKNDLWFHTKQIPGSHVIVKSDKQEIPETTIYEAALLASFYSKAKMSSNVPVDYTQKKYVRKPNGAKPGMVIYDNNNTIYVTPNKNEINKLEKVES